MKLFRRRHAPVATDSASSLNLPRVRMGLLAKLNLLTIGLVFLTAFATTGFYVFQQWRDESNELRQRGSTTLKMLAELAEFGLYTNNRAYLEAILESLPADGDIAYAAIVDAKRETLASRRIADSLGAAGLPAIPADAPLPALGATTTNTLAIRDHRYVEMTTPIGSTRITALLGLAQGPPEPVPESAGVAATPVPPSGPLGYVRLGLTSDRQQQQFRKHLVGALSVIPFILAYTAMSYYVFRGKVRAGEGYH